MEKNRQTTESNVNREIRYASKRESREIDLVELFYILLHQWKLLLVATVAGALLLGVYHVVLVKQTYRATTDLYITNTDSVISLQDLQIGSALAEDYRTIITSETVLDEVIERLKLDIGYEDLLELITVSNPTGTHIIKTSVVTTDPEASMNIANALLNVSIEQIYDIIGTGKPTVINYSKAKSVKNVTPSIWLYMLGGGMACLLLFVGILAIRLILDNTLKSEDDVEKYLGIAVLTDVPFFEE